MTTNQATEFNIARDGRLLLQSLWRLQNGICAYCGDTTEMPRRSLEQRKPEEATLEHIVPRFRGGKDVPGNLLMACCQCNTEKDTTDLHIFMLRKLEGLDGEKRRNLLGVEAALVPYFEQLQPPGVAVRLNPYMSLSLQRLFDLFDRRVVEDSAKKRKRDDAKFLAQVAKGKAQAAAKSPLAVVATSAPAEIFVVKPAAGAPAMESVPPKPETELEECRRLTQELQDLLATAYPGYVRYIMTSFAAVVELNDEELQNSLLNKIDRVTYGAILANELVEEVPEVLKHMQDGDKYEDGQWHLQKFPVPEGYSILQEQLRVQRLMASLERSVRQRVMQSFKPLLGTWHRHSMAYLALQAMTEIIASTSQLEQCFRTYPKLRQLVR